MFNRLTLGILICAVAYGQQFEVASVKPTAPNTPIKVSGGPGTPDPGTWTCLRCSLSSLLTYAYPMRAYQFASPDWFHTTNFDVIAKIPPGASRADFRLMVQALLAERFKMTTHRESRELAVYELVVAKGGSKMQEVSTPAPPPPPGGPDADKDGFPNIPNGSGIRFLNGRARLQFRAQTMDNLCNNLSGVADRPVLDATGLKGAFALTLSWFTADTDAGPTIYEALPAQLGLKLEPKKAMIEMLVIDHCEKTPIEN